MLAGFEGLRIDSKGVSITASGLNPYAGDCCNPFVVENERPVTGIVIKIHFLSFFLFFLILFFGYDY